MHTDSHNVVDLRAYRSERVRKIADVWPEDWAEAEPQPPRARFTLEWLPEWFALVALVADERYRALQREERKRK
jgi:hypothetical protein